MVNFEEISYRNFGKCVKLSNEYASVIITVEVGPRIISYCLNGKENILFEDVDRKFFEDGERHKEVFGDNTWYIYGGHRLWSSPESFPYSYVPDNSPVKYEIGADGTVGFRAPVTRTGQDHSTRVALDTDSPKVKVSHTLMNVSGAIVKLAPWALTVCSPGGVEIFPQNTMDTGLLSNRHNVFWSYSDINDDRFFLGNRYGTLKQVPGAEGKFKIGFNNEDRWAAYVNKEQIFIKNIITRDKGDYPDFGCNFETFTNGLFLECESLGPLTELQHGSAVYLSEEWNLIECNDSFDRKNEDSINKFVKKYGLDKGTNAAAYPGGNK